MAHKQSTRDKVRRLYVAERLSLDSAAKMCDVGFGTARRWRDEAKKDGDDWDKLRAAYSLAGGGLEDIARATLAEFLLHYQNTMQMLSNPDTEQMPPSMRTQLLSSLADAFAKTVAANKRVLPETSRLAVALEVLEMQLTFVQQQFPQHLEAFVQVAEPFAAEVECYLGKAA
ncbi:DUF1804 family protein [Kingella kingae]|uniref:DUF1804 family protein n=1 Tax=Kingella kingae TaxID=504 RepID=UPI00254F55D3|nr:DUF1804 family protein [Kingella kingae]MDK4535806.1 DUF1804 family protein [Kingella kingae]MDK4539664.1 DUF1804 family protein [Kingella kingae]MDK4547579.1 DUF1804 family protein [Kingella kingae]MDK4623422.1 DUF1804 family protein [Kingella kingae]